MGCFRRYFATVDVENSGQANGHYVTTSSRVFTRVSLQVFTNVSTQALVSTRLHRSLYVSPQVFTVSTRGVSTFEYQLESSQSLLSLLRVSTRVSTVFTVFTRSLLASLTRVFTWSLQNSPRSYLKTSRKYILAKPREIPVHNEKNGNNRREKKNERKHEHQKKNQVEQQSEKTTENSRNS